MKLFASKKGGMLLIILFIASGLMINVQAQTKVVLDNYFNHEVNAKTGKLYHYIWSDDTNSGFSLWGNIFEAKGSILDTLQSAPTSSNLHDANIYIIVDPDTKAETSSPNYIKKKDIRTIVKWVKKGGVLLLMANDSGNCEFQHLNNLARYFGIQFNKVSLSHVTGRQWNMGAFTDLHSHPVFSGIHKIYIKDASSISLSKSAKPVLTKDGHIFMAESHIGKGTVFAIGDPWIYNEYIGHKYLPDSFENHKAAENLTAYLIKQSENAR